MRGKFKRGNSYSDRRQANWSAAELRQWLEHAMPARQAQVERRLLQELETAFNATAKETAERAGGAVATPLLVQLVDFGKHFVTSQLDEVATLRQRYSEFTQRYSTAISEQERRQYILGFAKALGAGARQLAGDRRAFRRWFSQDAVIERYQRAVVERERKVAFALGRVGVWSAAAIAAADESSSPLVMWRRLDLERQIKPLLAYDGDSRVRIAAFHSLAAALKVMPVKSQESCVSDTTLQYVYRSALQRRQEIWIQTEALILLAGLSMSSLQAVLQRRLSEPGEGDDLFVRRRAVMLLCEYVDRMPGTEALIDKALNDPSAAVRQALADALPMAPARLVWQPLRHLALNDASAQVRARALLQVSDLLADDNAERSLALLAQVLTDDTDVFVLRVALKVAYDGFMALLDQGLEARADVWAMVVAPLIEHLHQTADHLPVRRWAAQARERLWVQATPERRLLHRVLQDRVAAIPGGGRGALKKQDFAGHDEQTIGRVLSVLALDDHGYALSKGRATSPIRRGHVFGFRAWRFLYEARRSATDKRQGFRHTTGRIFHGRVRAPSAVMAELAETKVPGEPLHMGSEAGWRPYLPLVDEAISCLDETIVGKPVRFYTSEGVTELTPPRSMTRRVAARTALTVRFAHYAHLRNWEEGGQSSPDSYAKALRALGFNIEFRPHETEQWFTPQADPAVQRFFPAVLPLGEVDWAGRFQDYFFSVYENSLFDLILFLGVAGALFGGRHVYMNSMLRRARNALPLVVGGWGTRGKSGTERLKAALFNGLGYSVVSKTTGCEAMFLHAPPYGKLREMFLFRPYDKATIWEQANVMQLSEKLGTDVFLWECMALTPSYVAVLQQEWVRDDIATITNTYPDHEDLQGPAGVNIPEVMTNFIPKSSVLLTTEEQMLPILRDGAKKRQTRIEPVTWLEAGLLPVDMLSRFPYEEHPYNIALVLAMADELGVDHDFALKEMADRVVLDLGVLKGYPTARVRGRDLEFINGMSANERFGCLNNWQRMGYAGHDWENEPNVWLTTVVNNRADRVARSQVFAALLAEELHTDRHFIIGTNLSGLLGYIDDAWARYAGDLSLWREDGERPLDVLRTMARRMRMPFDEKHVIARLHVMLGAVDGLDNGDALVAQWRAPESLRAALLEHTDEQTAETVLQNLNDYTARYDEYCRFAEKINGATVGDKGLDSEFSALLQGWFKSKLVVLEDPHLSGDQIIQRICDETPLGIHNRIMGVQNIKGTGLDFVYRWQAWEACHHAGVDLSSDEAAQVEQGLNTLVNFRDYGVLSDDFVRQTVETARHRPALQSEAKQAELQVILSNLDAAMKQVQARSATASGVSVVAKVANVVEAFLDAGDAVKRRKTADLIYRDLATQRIGHERAALELQALNKRQKGGWLAKQVYAVFSGWFGGNAAAAKKAN